MAADDKTRVCFACACGQVKGSVNIPTSKLPVGFDICHCNMCRHQSGLLAASFMTPPSDSTDFSYDGPISRYRSSDTVTRTFCSHCGASLCFEDSKQRWPDIATGTLERAEGLLKVGKHIFVADTKDGGMASWIPDIPAWEEFSSGKHVDVEQLTMTSRSHDDASELYAYCQCRGVQFKLLRPNIASNNLDAPPSDLLGHNHSGKSLAGDKGDTWWLCANGTKYLAGTCACRSCRLVSGFDIQTWAFVPKANILQTDGKPLDFTIGTLKQYQSSPGTYREFCGSCGAVVFWHNETRPKLIDVSVGLLDATEGSRAESWLAWKSDRISFQEEGQNQDLISTLGTGLKRWSGTKVAQMDKSF